MKEISLVVFKSFDLYGARLPDGRDTDPVAS